MSLGAAAEFQPDPESLGAALPLEHWAFPAPPPSWYDHMQQMWQRSQRVSDTLLAHRDGEISAWRMLLVSPSLVNALIRLQI